MPSKFLEPFRPGLDWLTDSGIQIPGGGDDAGGVYAWLDEATGKPSFIYSEITGYFMTLCVHLARHDSEGDWLRRAEAAGDFIVNRAMHPSGAILARKYDEPGHTDPYSFENQRVLFFDAAMVGYGLLCTHAATRNTRWLDAATRVGDFCLTAFESEDQQTRYAAYDLPSQSPVPADTRWSQWFGSFQLKCVLFLQTLAERTKEPRFAEFVDRILKDALKEQLPEGRFPTDGTRAATHLHPHFYTVEGLLFLASRGRRELLKPATKAIDWAFTHCLKPGQLTQQRSATPELTIDGIRSDTLAQGLRAYHVAKILQPETAFAWEDRVSELLEHWNTFRLTSGGTAYGQDEYGKKTQHANAWCHFFGLEMGLFRRARELGTLPDAGSLILT